MAGYAESYGRTKEMTKFKYAQIILGLPVDRAFTYSIPKELSALVKLGQRVEVPFGSRIKIGYVVGFLKKSSFKTTKPLRRILDENPLLDKQMLELTRKVADYYCASWGEVIEAAHPANVRNRKRPISQDALDTLHHATKDTSKGSGNISLTHKQRHALDLITKSIKGKKHQTFLLHGITASGKTEVYLRAIASVLTDGGSSIILVPEIALTPQTVERFQSRFGEKIALMHSRLSAKERLLQWQAIKKGKAQIVIGARSAVFAPVKNLKLIVIDEEHETTYKQQDCAPRYHVRQVAILRAKLTGATVVLGSATPSLESFHDTKEGKAKLLSLPERVTKRDLPEVIIVDMRQEIVAKARRFNVFSRSLEVKLDETLRRKEQAILFLNRRGFSTFISCTKCGYTAKCKRCNVSLTYHYARKKLVCHYCNFSSEPDQICPECSSSYLHYFGLGTEKVESQLHRLFPQARISRMDTDVTKTKGAHEKILGDFKRGKIDILIGTQMIAKGLDFPRVSLVGVISADTALNLPDFRSGERTFNLLTQVAGRAGRGESEGQVIIQTYVPKHYAIVASRSHDYQQFYRREINSRKELKLPPFSHLVGLSLRGKHQEAVQKVSYELSRCLKKKGAKAEIEVLGPAPAAISKVRGNFCWSVLLKGKAVPELVKLLKGVLKDFTRYKGMKLIVDVDPI